MSNKFHIFKSLKSFTFEFNIKGSHVALFLLSGYCCYRVGRAYQNWTDQYNLFSKNYKKIDESPYQQMHLWNYKLKINLNGYPDDGSWILSDYLKDEEWMQLNCAKKAYEKKYEELTHLLPLLCCSSFTFPWLATIGGLTYIYLDSKQQTEQNETYKKWLFYALGIISCFSSISLLMNLGVEYAQRFEKLQDEEVIYNNEKYKNDWGNHQNQDKLNINKIDDDLNKK